MRQLAGPIFKYMKLKHAIALLDEGIVRIGTLHEYREIERYGPEVGDHEEGKKTAFLSAEHRIVIDLLSDSAPAIFARKILKGWDRFPAGSQIIISMEQGSRLHLTAESPDLYIFCASTEYSLAMMREFRCDACLRIERPQEFFEGLSEAFLEYGTFEIGAEILYGPRERRFESQVDLHPALLKDERYAYQCEFRAVWLPAAANPRSRLVRCGLAASCCFLHATLAEDVWDRG